jgi:ATP-dependent DNA helicase DinG
VAAACKAVGLPYEPRAEQQTMAGVIEEALLRQKTQPVGILPIEAATGTGKTLAYLVPGALHAAKCGSRLLVSTHTIALGAQILHKDGLIAQKVVEAAIGERPRIAHMRGRRHFVSPSRARAVGNLLRDDGLPSSAWKPYLDIADATAQASLLAGEALEAGDFSETARDLIEAALLDRIEEAVGFPLAREDICLLASSPDDELAVYRLSRALAADATILITTHAYTAMSLARKALLGAEVNPFDMLVIDEADQWAGAASSVSLVSASMKDLQRGINNLLDASRHLKNPTELIEKASHAAHAVEALTELAPKARNSVELLSPDDRSIRSLASVVDKVEDLVHIAGRRRAHTAAASDALRDRVDDLKRIQRAVVRNETSFWTPRWTTSRVQGLPSIGIVGCAPGRILKRLWISDGSSEPLARTIVLTSATLSTPGFPASSRWRSIEIATGADPSTDIVLTDLATAIEPVKFGRMRVRFADPRAPAQKIDAEGNIAPDALSYSAEVIAAAMNASSSVNGRTLVLVPSYGDVDRLAALLPSAIIHRPGVPVQKVLEAYRSTPGCCLITPGAWVGADLPGLIQNLVIPRIPFPPSAPGGQGNIVQLLSDTLTKLAQGIGRAIRCEADDVTLWFADSRMPIPESVTEETGLLPARHSNAALLGAIPKRFRDAFGREPGSASIGIPFVADQRPAVRPKSDKIGGVRGKSGARKAGGVEAPPAKKRKAS